MNEPQAEWSIWNGSGQAEENNQIRHGVGRRGRKNENQAAMAKAKMLKESINEEAKR